MAVDGRRPVRPSRRRPGRCCPWGPGGNRPRGAGRADIWLVETPTATAAIGGRAAGGGRFSDALALCAGRPGCRAGRGPAAGPVGHRPARGLRAAPRRLLGASRRLAVRCGDHAGLRRPAGPAVIAGSGEPRAWSPGHHGQGLGQAGGALADRSCRSWWRDLEISGGGAETLPELVEERLRTCRNRVGASVLADDAPKKVTITPAGYDDLVLGCRFVADERQLAVGREA